MEDINITADAVNKTCPQCGKEHKNYYIGCPECVLSNKKKNHGDTFRGEKDSSLRLLRIINILSLPGAAIIGLYMAESEPLVKKILPAFLCFGVVLVGFNHWTYTKQLAKPKEVEIKDSKTRDRRSYVKLYWIVWLVMVATLIIAKTTLSSYTEGQLFDLFNTYALVSWLPIIGINLFESLRLNFYLRKFHYEKWKELTSIGDYLVGHFNVFKFLPFLFSVENFNDPTLDKLKKSCKNVLLLTLTVFLTMIPLFVFVGTF